MRSVNRNAAAFFDDRAAAYDSGYDERGSGGHAVRARLEAVLGFVGSGPGEALDAGMGPGRLLAQLAARGWSVSGVDASAEMVGVAKRRLVEAESRLLHSKIERLPFDNASFDVVIATGVLEYADLHAALAELARVLRPGGLAVVSYANRHAAYALWKTRVFYPAVEIAKRLMGHPPRIRPVGQPLVAPARFRELLSEAGLRPEATRHTSFLAVPSPLDTLLPGVAEYLGRRLDDSGPRLGALLSTQIVFSARKP